MKYLSFLLSLGLLVSSNAFALIGNTNNGTSTDIISTAINAARFLSPSNMTVGTIKSKVTGSGGKYKAAIYNGSASLPTTFIQGTDVLTITTNGWYTFTLASPVSITNAQNYWLAIWSDTTSSANYYTSGGTVRWVTSSGYSETWPTTLNTDGGGTFNYCIYAEDVIVPPATNPPPVTTNGVAVTLAWNASPDSSVTGYRIYRGLSSRNYDATATVGNTLITTLGGLEKSTTYYFTATAYDAAGTESPFSNEISYTTPNFIPNAPVFLNLELSK